MNKIITLSLSTACLLAACMAPALAAPTAAMPAGAAPAGAAPAGAAPVTGATPCAVITDYLDQNNKPGIDGFVAYAIGQFKTLDASFTAVNGHGVFDLLSVGQVNNTTAIASVWCSTHPSNNAHDAAVFAYDGASEIGLAVASAN
jgi:hypothetical protein